MSYLGGDRRGRDRMVLGLTTTYAISVNHHYRCKLESRSDEVYSIQHYVITTVSNLRQIDGFLRYSGFLHQ